MKTITINGQYFCIEPDHYEGDIVLINAQGNDYVILGGYTQLKSLGEMAGLATLGYEPSREDVTEYVSQHIENYVIEHFKDAEMIVNE